MKKASTLSAKEGNVLVNAIQSTFDSDVMDIYRKCDQIMCIANSSNSAAVQLLNLIGSKEDVIQLCIDRALEFVVFCQKKGIQSEHFDIKRKE